MCQFKHISSISATISLVPATSQVELLSRMSHNSLKHYIEWAVDKVRTVLF